MKKEIPTLPFNSSQGMIMLAASIYSVALSFIVQEYVSSPAVNSLVNNISVAVSVAFALGIGIFLTLIMALVLGFFEGRVKSSVALYFSAGAIILLVIFCLVLLQSAREKNA